MTPRDAAARHDEVALFTAADQHAGAGHTDDTARAHLAQEPGRDVVRVDVRDRPLRTRAASASRGRRATARRALVRAVRGRRVDGEIEYQPMLADFQMRVVEQFHGCRAKNFAVNPDGEA